MTDAPSTAKCLEACDCLLMSVRDLETFARGELTRHVESLIVRAAIVTSSLTSRSVKVPDLSLGPYQLRLSTVARFLSVSFERDGKWLRMEKDDAARVASGCLTEATARMHARRRIGEALEEATIRHLDPFAATAMVYAGELPLTIGSPYQTRLRIRYRLRHYMCAASNYRVVAQFESMRNRWRMTGGSPGERAARATAARTRSRGRRQRS
jgi:hypothetical protein